MIIKGYFDFGIKINAKLLIKMKKFTNFTNFKKLKISLK